MWKQSRSWNTTAQTRYPPLGGPIEVDVAIIGAGITGLTAGLQLVRAGKRVALIDLDTVGAGSTGDSTGHLTACLDRSYQELTADFGQDGARAAAKSSMSAIDFIERTISELAIECDFMRVPGFRYSHDSQGAAMLEKEAALTRTLGLSTSFSRESPLPSPRSSVQGSLRFDDQARFDAPLYCRALAAAVQQHGSFVFGDTLVDSVDEPAEVGDPCVVHAAGYVVRAGAVIMATHTPLNRVLTLQTQLSPNTTYTMAFSLGAAPFPQGLFWDTEQPYHYVRSLRDKDRRMLLVGGEDHPTGHEADTTKRFEALEAYARLHFDVGTVEYHGSGQVFSSPDGLPYIGQLPGMTRVHVATGYSGTGLTFGTIAGLMLSDRVLGRSNGWEELYSPARVKLLSIAIPVVEAAASAAWHYVTDHLSHAETESLSEVSAGQGKLVEIDGKKAAVYRDEGGALSLLDPACTHMGCTVQWNGAALSWDCPCHGGRFRPTGQVLCGPPTQSLRPFRPPVVEEAATVPEEGKLA